MNARSRSIRCTAATIARTATQVTALVASLFGPMGAMAQSASADALDPADALRTSQAVIGKRIGDYMLQDRDGRPVRLSDFRGKPLLVSFIYTGCFQVCPTTTRALADAVRALHARFGTRQFNVASIGFNQPADSPQALKAFAAQHRIDEPDWTFLSPSAQAVEPLTREFGFRYRATAAGFDHLLQVSLLDANGRIVRQIYGDTIGVDEIGEPMKQLLAGAPLPARFALADLVDRVRLLCTVYDPRTGTYRVDYSLALEIAGGITFMIAMALYMLNEWRNRRHSRRRAPAP